MSKCVIPIPSQSSVSSRAGIRTRYSRTLRLIAYSFQDHRPRSISRRIDPEMKYPLRT